jgi:hypothetical protein
MNRNSIVAFISLFVSLAVVTSTVHTMEYTIEQCNVSEGTRLRINKLHQLLQPLLKEIFPVLRNHYSEKAAQALIFLTKPNILQQDAFTLLTHLKKSKIMLDSYRIWLSQIVQEGLGDRFFEDPIEQGIRDQKCAKASSFIQQLYDTIFNACQLSPEQKQSLNSIQ